MPVIKYGEDRFTKVLDTLLMYGSLTKASAAAGIASYTLARWRRASEDGAEEFQDVEYRGLIKPLHEHVEDTIEQSIDEIESNLRGSARDGYYRPIIWHGEYCYEPDEVAAAMSDAEFADAVELGICWPDKLKRVRDANGKWVRVRMMEHIMPTTEAQALVLRSWSDRYADKRTLNVNGRFEVNQSLGVTVMGTPKLAPPPQQLQVVSPPIADAINESATDAVFAEIEQPEDDAMTELAPDQPFEPDPNSPLSAEDQAILARARSNTRTAAPKPAPVVRPTPPPPSPPAYRDVDQDDCIRRTPRGMKVV